MGIEINYRFLDDATVEEVRRLKAASLNILAQTVKTAKQKRPGLNRTLTVNLLKALFP
jgi:hypothetical protein